MTEVSHSGRYATGRAALQTGLLEARRKNLQPPPKLTLSQWAERYAVLSRETSAQTGRFRAFGYQVGMMDAVTDPTVHTITVMKSARVGYTKMLDHTIGYFVHQDPSPIMVVQPRVEDAEDYSKTEVAPMLRDTPELAAIAGDPKAKDSGQTILKKSFTNGASLTLTGANSPGGFRRITARVVLFDEVDGYPAGGAGPDGDQIALGKKRTETFWNRKIILGSTPTIKGVSRIEKSFDESDKRFYFVPCPHCGELQRLEWGGKESSYGIKWERDEQGNHLPETAHYVCINGCIIDEIDKPAMIAAGVWKATAPFKGHAGYHVWAGYSLFPNASWKLLAEEWLRVKNDPLARQTFINLVLGEPYEDKGDQALNEHSLAARTEVWADEVPFGVGVLTASGDTQKDRVEILVTGWGMHEESWKVAHEVFEGDPDTDELWERVDLYLKRTFRRADGRGFTIAAACIDSGGHSTQKVYEFCKSRIGRRIWAIKGESARGGKRSPVWPTKKPSARNKSAYRPIILGVNAAKDVIRNRLHLKDPGPGYMHYSSDTDIGFFQQLVSERLITKTVGGQRFRVWELPSGRANEALDLTVYCYAALCGLMHMGLKLNREVAKTEEPPENPIPKLPDQETDSPPVIPVVPHSGPAVIVKSQPKKSIATRLA